MRHLDGRPLTVDELLDIAAEAGLDVIGLRHACGELHNENASRSLVSFATRAAQHDLWARGELLLDTRPVSRPVITHSIDVEVFEFLMGTLASTTSGGTT